MSRVQLISIVVIFGVTLGVATLPENISYGTITEKVSFFIEASKEEPIVLVFGGDVMLSRGIGRIMAEKKDWAYHAASTSAFFAQADLSFVNLENPIGTRGVKIGSIYSFRADPKSIATLEALGVDVVSIANNHIWDYGRLAFEDTLALLGKAGISVSGGGVDYASAHAAIIKEVRGTKIAFFSYTNLLPASLGTKVSKPTVALINETQMAIDIDHAQKTADMVIVSFHWGEEYQTTHNAYQEKIAKSAIDAGAHLIVGHHPHVVQDIGSYKEVPIIYSLGNFIFDQNFSEVTHTGMLLKVTILGKKIEKVEPIVIRFADDYMPYLVP